MKHRLIAWLTLLPALLMAMPLWAGAAAAEVQTSFTDVPADA